MCVCTQLWHNMPRQHDVVSINDVYRGDDTFVSRGIETCHYPTNGFAETSVVAMAELEAPAEVAVTVLAATGSYPGQPRLNVRWNLPLDTGTKAFKVVKSTHVNFTISEHIFYGLPTPTGNIEESYRYQIDDADSLSAGVHYYYRIYVQNAACGSLNITCSPFNVGGRNATGLPSRPMQIVGNLLDSSRIKLDWILPFDTGQGGGNNARFAVFFHFCPASSSPCR